MSNDVSQALSYEQRPIFPLGIVGMPVFWGGCAAGVLWWRGNPVRLQTLPILLAIILGIVLVLVVAVLPQSMKRVRVDSDGMHVKGKLALPASRIGQIQALSGGDAATQSWPISRNRGLKMPGRQNLYGGLYGWGPALGVEEIDRNGERVSSWLIPTRDPEGLTAALEHARDHAGTTTTGG